MSLNNLPRGQLSTIILSFLIEKDKYGYEILSEIKEKSNGELIIKQPSLYSALSRMEKQGYISSYWQNGNIGGRRHYYSLNDLGKKQIEHLKSQVYVTENKHSKHNLKPFPEKPVTVIGNKKPESDSDDNIKIKNIDLNIIKNNEKNSMPQPESALISQQNSFFNSSLLKIQVKNNYKSEKEFANQINIFDKNIDLTRKKFNIEHEIDSHKPENFSFTEKIKGNTSKILSLDSEKQNKNDEINIPKSYNFSKENTSASAIYNIQENLSDKAQDVDLITKQISEKISARQNDDGVFITAKYKSDEMPKVKKINPLRINDVNEKDALKLKSNIEYGYTEMINELYKKSNYSKDKNIFTSNAPTYAELKNYYEGINVKFSAYKPKNETQKDHLKTNKHYIDYNKAGLKKYLILFVLIALESLGCYLVFDYFNLEVTYSELYFIIPAVFLIKTMYYLIMVLKKKSKVITEFKINPLWLDLIIILVGIVLLYSVNMLFGLTYINITDFATTFIYPSVLSLNLILIYILNITIFKEIIKII